MGGNSYRYPQGVSSTTPARGSHLPTEAGSQPVKLTSGSRPTKALVGNQPKGVFCVSHGADDRRRPDAELFFVLPREGRGSGCGVVVAEMLSLGWRWSGNEYFCKLQTISLAHLPVGWRDYWVVVGTIDCGNRHWI